MFDCGSGLHQSEEKRNSHINLCDLYHDYYIYYVFAKTEYIISCYFSICAFSFVAFVCISYSHVVQECLCGVRQMNVMHSWFMRRSHIVKKNHLFFGGFSFIRYKTL